MLWCSASFNVSSSLCPAYALALTEGRSLRASLVFCHIEELILTLRTTRGNPQIPSVERAQPTDPVLPPVLSNLFWQAKHHPDLIMCRKQPGIAIGRLCEKHDGVCVICDSYVRPTILVRICDECNYGSYQVPNACCYLLSSTHFLQRSVSACSSLSVYLWLLWLFSGCLLCSTSTSTV